MKKNKGFSLIEMAIALIILGFILGGLIIPLRSQRDQQQIYRTVSSLEEVKDALLGFAVIHGRLPCSDQNGDGKEDRKEKITPYGSIMICEYNNEGYLPWKDLGVGRYDAWSNPFRYRVDKKYSSGIPSELKADEDKKLKVINLQSTFDWTTLETEPETEPETSRVIAIIFSYGQNGKADSGNKFTAANDATYVRDVYVKKGTNAFDDILTWLSKYTLINRLIEAKDKDLFPELTE